MCHNANLSLCPWIVTHLRICLHLFLSACQQFPLFRQPTRVHPQPPSSPPFPGKRHQTLSSFLSVGFLCSPKKFHNKLNTMFLEPVTDLPLCSKHLSHLLILDPSSYPYNYIFVTMAARRRQDEKWYQLYIITKRRQKILVTVAVHFSL